MTIFDVRIPGLKMTVVASDGQNIEPISIDEFRIGVAETYDVIVEPDGDSAYTIFAQSIDRTGFTRGVLTSDASLQAEVPSMDYAPTLGHTDMGMSMEGMDHSAHSGHGAVIDHSQMGHMDHSMMHSGVGEIDHSKMDHSMNHGSHHLGKAGYGTNSDIIHVKTEWGPHVDMQAEIMQNGIADPGIGLRDHQQTLWPQSINLCRYS